MKKIIAMIIATLSCQQAGAGTEKLSNGICKLVVSGKTYMTGPCKISDYAFTDSTKHDIFFKGKKYFGYLNQNDDGSFEGFWNAPDAETHAQAPLGLLHRKGQCWHSKSVQICINYQRPT